MGGSHSLRTSLMQRGFARPSCFGLPVHRKRWAGWDVERRHEGQGRAIRAAELALADLRACTSSFVTPAACSGKWHVHASLPLCSRDLMRATRCCSSARRPITRSASPKPVARAHRWIALIFMSWVQKRCASFPSCLATASRQSRGRNRHRCRHEHRSGRRDRLDPSRWPSTTPRSPSPSVWKTASKSAMSISGNERGLNHAGTIAERFSVRGQ